VAIYPQAVLAGKRNVDWLGNFLCMVRGITTGGSSIFYYGTCYPVPHKMLAKYGIDVSKEEAEARKELPVAPLKSEMVTPMASRITKGTPGRGGQSLRSGICAQRKKGQGIWVKNNYFCGRHRYSGYFEGDGDEKCRNKFFL